MIAKGPSRHAESGPRDQPPLGGFPTNRPVVYGRRSKAEAPAANKEAANVQARQRKHADLCRRGGDGGGRGAGRAATLGAEDAGAAEWGRLGGARYRLLCE